MSINRTVVLLLTCSVILLTSCTMAPILNLNNEILPADPNGSTHTQDDVQKAILRACNDRGWSAQVESEGVIQASIIVRRHSAKVKIQYTNSTVSISYVDSTELKYKGDRIHRNYNRWVANLYHSIQTELGSHGQAF